MLKETETEETISFFVIFLSLVTFLLGEPWLPGPRWLRLWLKIVFDVALKSLFSLSYFLAIFGERCNKKLKTKQKSCKTKLGKQHHTSRFKEVP